MAFNHTFSRTAKWIAHASGRPTTFGIALGIILIWAVTGPIFHYSDTWQLFINTGTTIVTFLMVFLIQNTQNRDSIAMQIKLDELIRALRGAHNTVVSLEDADELELLAVKKRYDELAARARGRGGPDTGSPELEAEVADAERAAKHRLRKPDASRD
jgi:low affinity Fe/Cu permease